VPKDGCIVANHIGGTVHGRRYAQQRKSPATVPGLSSWNLGELLLVLLAGLVVLVALLATLLTTLMLLTGLLILPALLLTALLATLILLATLVLALLVLVAHNVSSGVES
jgi:hypothetical protein